eukprot:TRINITY_DN2164_c0_g1_i2.p1 TRINITY_DN2164_c0_g1~~TRINITY_DN2164_c0_g1_i2.p1  ORF type:complete len:988 (-),score=189.50 TRINITY_DN2164_c0_g1_i2:79-3021(-)
MATVYNWQPRERDYGQERATQLTRKPVAKGHHPLSKNPAAPSANGASSSAQSPLHSSAQSSLHGAKAKSTPSPKVADDPLSAFLDPLSMPTTSNSHKEDTAHIDEIERIAQQSSSRNKPGKDTGGDDIIHKVAQEEEEGFIPWSTHKKNILQNYTTDETVGIQANFLDTQARVNLPVDKQKQRLEELEDSEEALEKEILKVSQKEYIGHIEKLREQLIKAWDAEDRVKSLKIAIQCAKVLSDTAVIKFYPSKWVMITEILDTFGKLVFERIYERAEAGDNGIPIKLKPNFSPKDIPDTARETCRNWFFKIASIRELLPRFYVELCIIKCYAFLAQNSYREVINRLCMMTRGIGDPLIATFARAYLSRKGREIIPGQREYLIGGFNDYVYSMQVVMKRPQFQKFLDDTHILLPDYVHLFSPAIEWMLQCIAWKADMSVFNAILLKYKESGNALVLNHIISSFHPDFIAGNAQPIALLIKDADETAFSRAKLYRSFGVCLGLGKGPGEQMEDKLALMNEVWRVVTKFKDVKDYISVAEVFIDYPLTHCTQREVNALLGDVLKHVKPEKAYENLQPQLQSLLLKILAKYHDFAVVFGMTNFLPILDLFSGSTAVEVNKAILTNFAKHQHRTRDPVVINCMFGVSKIVHDSVNALTFVDEVRQIAALICQFMAKIDFGRDLVKHLDFYAEARRSFANLDAVKAYLVQGVNTLAVRTLTLSNGTHSHKTAAFVRACIAYNFITIPSMDDVFQRLYLYVLSGQVALLNLSLPQAEALLKAALTLTQEVPSHIEEEGRLVSTEDSVVSFVCYLASVLIPMPGHPEHGPFYLLKGLLQVVLNYPWLPESTNKGVVLARLLAIFSSFGQPSLPFHIPKLDSNDTLYAGDDAYREELLAMTASLAELIKEQIDVFKETPKQQAIIALALAEQTLRFAQLTAKTATLVYEMYTVAKKAGVPARDLARVRAAVLSPAHSSNKIAAELYKKLD